MKRLSMAMLMLALILCAPARADDQEQQLKELIAQMDAQPQKVIAFCAAYTAEPYGEKADTIGKMLLTYGQRSEKVNINIKDYVIAPLLATKPDDPAERVLTLFITNLLSYALKNGGKAGDDDASNLSALQNIVDGYANMLKIHPDKTNAFAADLTKIAQQKNGLQTYLADAKKKAETASPK